MKAKVKKFFSGIFVKTYDYPFIVGFLEAHGIEDVIPSLKQKNKRFCISYDDFKKWWAKNYEGSGNIVNTVCINDDDFDIDVEINFATGLIKHKIIQGDKSVVLNLDADANVFLLHNFRKAGREFLAKSEPKNIVDVLHYIKLNELLG